MEYNAISNMGLCLFQDFFVTKGIYKENKGYLNGLAIYSVGLLGSLISMLYFRYMNKFKRVDSFSVSYDF